MPMYTFIMEYDGGTYFSQVDGRDVHSAIENWINLSDPRSGDVRFTPDDNWSSEIRKKMHEKSELFYKIDNLSSVWFITFLINDISAFVDIVKTEPE